MNKVIMVLPVAALFGLITSCGDSGGGGHGGSAADCKSSCEKEKSCALDPASYDLDKCIKDCEKKAALARDILQDAYITADVKCDDKSCDERNICKSLALNKCSMPSNVDTYATAYCDKQSECNPSTNKEACKTSVKASPIVCFTEKGIAKLSDCTRKAGCKELNINNEDIDKCMSL
jgi:hypothetical protein